MKKHMSLIILLVVVYPVSILSQCSLIIEIENIKNNTGNIMLQLFDENETVLSGEISAIIDRKCKFHFKDLMVGKYAVRYYHDENLNGIMESNIVGKPTEGYGFSNNVTGRFGPPPFEKWLFEIHDEKKIVLKPTY